MIQMDFRWKFMSKNYNYKADYERRYGNEQL